MRDVVAEARPLAAYFADGSHSSLHLLVVTWGPCPPRGRIRQPSKLTRCQVAMRTEHSEPERSEVRGCQGVVPPWEHCRPALSVGAPMLPGVTTLGEPL